MTLTAAQMIDSERLIAIVRARGCDQAVEHAATLLTAGVRIVEISMTTPSAVRAIRKVSEDSKAALVGAGTVRSVADAERAVAAGAQFMVSPSLDREVIAWAAHHGVLHLPGVLTPTELNQALDAGAEYVKLFPAGRMGAGYVRDLLAPFPGARLVPTGGIDLARAPSYIEHGAVAVAIGSALFDTDGRADLASAATALRNLDPACTAGGGRSSRLASGHRCKGHVTGAAPR